MAGSEAAFLEILLMIVLGAIEGLGRLDRGDDRPAEALRRFEPSLGRLGGCLLQRRVEEDRRAVLRPDIGALAVQGRRVMVLPEDVEELLIARSGRIALDLDDLGMAGFVAAQVTISWVYRHAARICGSGWNDAGEPAQ